MENEIHIYKMIYSEKDNIVNDKDEKKAKNIEWYCATVPSRIELNEGKKEYSLEGEILKPSLFFLANSNLDKKLKDSNVIIFKVPQNLLKYSELKNSDEKQKIIERKELNEEEIKKFSKYWK